MYTRGRGANTSNYILKKSFLNAFCNILICKVLLSYFVVLCDDDSHYCFIKQVSKLFSYRSDVLKSFYPYGIID